MDITYINSLMIGTTLFTSSLAIVALVAGLLYFLFSQSKKISNLESGQEAFQSRITSYIQEVMRKVPTSNNPGEDIAIRRDQLLAKLRANEITRTEALELNDILIREKEAAEKRSDIAALIAIILGLALLAAVLAKSK